MSPKMYCIILTAAIYLFYNYFNYLPGENIYEIPENELSFSKALNFQQIPHNKKKM